MNIFPRKPSPYFFPLVLYIRFVAFYPAFCLQVAYALLLPNVSSRVINYRVIDYFELSFSQLWNAFSNDAISSTLGASCLSQRTYVDV